MDERGKHPGYEHILVEQWRLTQTRGRAPLQYPSNSETYPLEMSSLSRSRKSIDDSETVKSKKPTTYERTTYQATTINQVPYKPKDNFQSNKLKPEKKNLLNPKRSKIIPTPPHHKTIPAAPKKKEAYLTISNFWESLKDLPEGGKRRDEKKQNPQKQKEPILRETLSLFAPYINLLGTASEKKFDWGSFIK